MPDKKEEKLNRKKTWKEQFVENYNGRSEEAQEVADFIKETYKGDSYIPWATMERLTYMQDPEAKFETLETENGNIIFSDTLLNENKVVQKGEVVSETIATMMSHFIKVKLTFMGKEFVEEYPIQDQDYSALKVFNQNAVNKALKRALAKVASRATGIGLRLYENKDLQFDLPTEDKKPEVKKTTKTTKTTKKVEMTEEQKATNILDGGETSAYLNGERILEPQQVPSQVTYTEEDLKQDAPVQEVVTQDAKVEENASKSYADNVIELCNLIKTSDKDKMTSVLQSLNVAILRQHGFVLSLDDTDEDLCEKLSHFKDVSVFTRAINNLLG